MATTVCQKFTNKKLPVTLCILDSCIIYLRVFFFFIYLFKLMKINIVINLHKILSFCLKETLKQFEKQSIYIKFSLFLFTYKYI